MLYWDYAKHHIHLSMPGYVDKALHQFQHSKPTAPQHVTFPTAPIKYGTRTQYAKVPSTLPLLNQKGKKFIQQVCGKFLFLGRAVDPTLLCSISAITSQSLKPTINPLSTHSSTQNSSSITLPPKTMQFSPTTPATWS
jgi:hypothetical protein